MINRRVWGAGIGSLQMFTLALLILSGAFISSDLWVAESVHFNLNPSRHYRHQTNQPNAIVAVLSQ